MRAAAKGRADIARLLVERGANPNAATQKGHTALMFAAVDGHIDIARQLIEKGADVNAASENGLTVLMWAAMQGHTDIARLLIERGANVKAAIPEGKKFAGATALDVAKERGHTAFVEMLRAAGAKE